MRCPAGVGAPVRDGRRRMSCPDDNERLCPKERQSPPGLGGDEVRDNGTRAVVGRAALGVSGKLLVPARHGHGYRIDGGCGEESTWKPHADP